MPKIPVERRSPYDSDADANIIDPTLDIEKFCKAECISRSMLYKSWTEGWGPEFFWVGNVRRITQRARHKWHRQREAEARQRELVDISEK
jgi:hypothetical protein